MADIKPTRSELIKLKIKIKLARSGHKLLKKKRDGLIMEFFEILKKVKTVREDMTKQFIASQKKLNIARVMESDLKIKSLAMAISERPAVDIYTKNIVGVVVPKIESKEIRKKVMNRGFGVFNSAAIDEVAESYEKLVEKIIRVAEVETTVRKMLEEIEKTKRRVNALEFLVIPNMQKQAAFITMRLEEMERENFSRLKMLKKD
jgi:V/A-type H+-transporting ATPase subunit D